MPEIEKANGAMERMVLRQIVHRGISNPILLAAIRSVPREKFFPPGSDESPYADAAASIGHGQTISQPYIVALMTDALDLHPEHRVLEVGTGSGYQTAVLARLGAGVWTVERIKPLLDAAFSRLSDLGIRNVHCRLGDGTLGWPEAAPFDRILIAAGAPKIPADLLLSQLVEGGIAVIPVGPNDAQMLQKITRRGGELLSVNLCSCRFVKLIGQEGWES